MTKTKKATKKRKQGLTLDELRQRVLSHVFKAGKHETSLLYLGHGGEFCEVQPELTRGAFEEIWRKLPLVMIGIDEFTACEKLMYQLFLIHAEQAPYRPLVG